MLTTSSSSIYTFLFSSFFFFFKNAASFIISPFRLLFFFFFFFNDTATTEIYTLSLHDALPISYRMWRALENLPIFMRHLESVRARGDGRSEWTAIGPLNTRIRWNAEITEDRENDFLAWRSTQDSDFQTWGSVEFRRAPGNRGTIVSAEMEYAPPGGVLGKAAAAVFGKDPEFTMREDLRRFKALIRSHEIPTTERQPISPRSAVHSSIRPKYHRYSSH